ncbi:11743_t:CDS:2 [Ambispora gerdemannii]|uniref:11743_t:CDS:1 n=1 Tax=Ambispora gerdemannii TaxID=144530 RepID=A0A9N8YN28_9GLOM|nr:11743_t:CDS:2 [Ambispora gerdemannii]
MEEYRDNVQISPNIESVNESNSQKTNSIPGLQNNIGNNADILTNIITLPVTMLPSNLPVSMSQEQDVLPEEIHDPHEPLSSDYRRFRRLT